MLSCCGVCAPTLVLWHSSCVWAACLGAPCLSSAAPAALPCCCSLRDWKQLELFEREAQILKNLSQPGIPQASAAAGCCCLGCARCCRLLLARVARHSLPVKACQCRHIVSMALLLLLLLLKPSPPFSPLARSTSSTLSRTRSRTVPLCWCRWGLLLGQLQPCWARARHAATNQHALVLPCPLTRSPSQSHCVAACLAQELAQGKSLADLVASGWRADEAEVRSWLVIGFCWIAPSGQLYRLAFYRLVCGDCCQAERRACLVVKCRSPASHSSCWTSWATWAAAARPSSTGECVGRKQQLHLRMPLHISGISGR